MASLPMLYTKVGNAWRPGNRPSVKVNGVYRPATNIHVKVRNSFRRVAMPATDRFVITRDSAFQSTVNEYWNRNGYFYVSFFADNRTFRYVYFDGNSPNDRIVLAHDNTRYDFSNRARVPITKTIGYSTTGNNNVALLLTDDVENDEYGDGLKTFGLFRLISFTTYGSNQVVEIIINKNSGSYGFERSYNNFWNAVKRIVLTNSTSDY